MNLSLRLNLQFASVLLLMLCIAAVLIIRHARESVADEIDSAFTLTRQLLQAISVTRIEAPPATGTQAPPGADGGGDGATATARLQARRELVAEVVERIQRLQGVRHLDISLVRNDGLQPLGPPPGGRIPPGGVAAGTQAPGWFAALVAPTPIEERVQLSLQGWRVAIALRSNPADEIREAWVESRSTFLILVTFALVVMALTWFTIRRALQPVGHVLTALRSLERGDRSARLEAFDLPELQRISTHFNRVADTLARQEAENRELSRQALAIQENERRRLARELHDELGQAISAIKALAVSVRRRAVGEAAIVDPADTISEVCDQMYDAVRRLIGELRPAALDTLGLRAALGRLVDDWRGRHDGTICTLQLDAATERLSEDKAIKIFRIVQEGLTNVARHARAASVTVESRLEGTATIPPALVLRIVDDGVGFDTRATRQGLGLLGMRERVSSMDGEFVVRSRPGAGTELRVTVPLA